MAAGHAYARNMRSTMKLILVSNLRDGLFAFDQD